MKTNPLYTRALRLKAQAQNVVPRIFAFLTYTENLSKLERSL